MGECAAMCGPTPVLAHPDEGRLIEDDVVPGLVAPIERQDKILVLEQRRVIMRQAGGPVFHQIQRVAD